jgi:hypothetical protein
MRMMENRIKALEQLAKSSPLEVTAKLQEFEMYDMKSSQEIIDEVYQEFQSGEHLADSVLKPVFLSIVDGVLDAFGKSARKNGLTASRVVQECEQFSYDDETDNRSNVNGYTEYRNATDYNKKYAEEHRPKFIREKYVNTSKMRRYKFNKFKDENGRIIRNKNIKDEYTGEKNIYVFRADPDKRRNDPKFDFQAETDHIISLKELHSQFKGNYALSDADIRKIANSDYNFAVTSGKINGKKLEQSNSEFIKEQEKLGEKGLKLTAATKANMVRLEKEANKAINKEVNSTVFNNITGKGNKEQTEIIHQQLKDNAVDQSKNYAVGNLIMFIVKPIYFELKDCFKNGIAEGVGASSALEALKIRFGRVKDHVLKNALSFLGESIWEFVKGFISSLIEGIISLFVGVFKQVLKVLKEGIKLFVQSAKILFGKDSKEMTPSQKGDAIIKLIGGSIIAIAGVGIEALLNKIGIGEPWSIILSTFLSGLASALFMYLMDKADIFSVKAEKRRDRIAEIFTERINDINSAANDFNTVAIETLRMQHQGFVEIQNNVNQAFANNDIDSINAGLYKMADFFNINLPFKNTSEFVDYFDSEDVIKL